jgi:hypothetical protein
MTLSLALSLCKVFFSTASSGAPSFILTEAVAGDIILLETVAVSKLELE